MNAMPRRLNMGQAAKAVWWSFLGIRKRRDYDQDAVKLTPGQVIVAGLVGAALFIALLLVVVTLVTHLGSVQT